MRISFCFKTAFFMYIRIKIGYSVFVYFFHSPSNVMCIIFISIGMQSVFLLLPLLSDTLTNLSGRIYINAGLKGS